MFLSEPAESEATARLYQASLEGQGFVMNLTRLWARRPDVFDAFAQLRTLLSSQSTLTGRDLAVMVSATAASLGDAYCALAWGKKLADAAGPAEAAAVLQSRDDDALPARDRALAAWTRRVVKSPNESTPADMAALRAAGFSEQEIFEATVFIAFRLAFSTVNDALGANPDWQLAEAAPAEVRGAVNYGRPTMSRAS